MLDALPPARVRALPAEGVELLSLELPSASPPALAPTAEFQLIVTANPDAVYRIVRVASTGPITLLTLWLGKPLAGRRKMRMSVGGDPETFETVRKRLDRVVDIVKVRMKVAS